ncbi:uncharacterized protein LOC133799706 [Humulus lupulus]|uniref:uncharacterized protein LOC133799706 n=1 Tax=Humulus lupulus TaxID=3486 RepID=UPI002B407ABB|nr:uncharacterized protein LOC133799706 [Humulus lupulus]
MNTSYFHACLKKRRAENGIATYITEQGRLIDYFHDVVSHFVEHFRSYLGSPSSATGWIDLRCIEMGAKLSVDQQLILLKPFTHKEIRDALFRNFPSELHETTLSLVPKVVLPDLIQLNQGAFIQGRSIAHNIMIFQDLIENCGRTSTSPRCAIKIDLSNACDTVDWQFLEDLLKAFCFPMKFIGWIMSSRQFQGREMGCQGDPMSPLLFVLIMEYLTRSLQVAAHKSTFRFHPMCKSLILLNLCFADDLILFCKGTLSAIRVFKEVLEEFSAATGLSINASKSHIFFGVNAAERRNITQEI